MGIAQGVRDASAYLVNGVAETLWPTRCVGCERPGTLLCPDCAAALPAIDQAYACTRCGAPFGSLVCTECSTCCDGGDEGLNVGRDGGFGGHVGFRAVAGGLAAAELDQCEGALDEVRQEPEDNGVARVLAELEGVCCYGVHAWPLDRLVRAYKDGGELRVSTLVADLIAQATMQGFGTSEKAGAPALPFDAVTFVPCTPQAFARRGHDHMERVACEVSERLSLPLMDVLARHAPRDQRGLTRSARAVNAQASLVAVRRVPGARLLLLDDVLTTGATLGAAAKTLKQAGASTVHAATAARAG